MPANTGLTESEYRQFDALCDSAKDLARKRSPVQVRQLLHALQEFKNARSELVLVPIGNETRRILRLPLFGSASSREVTPLSHIARRMTIPVDRERLLEVQFAELAEKGKIRGDWWKELTSEHYPADKSRPSMITLGECHFNKYFENGDVVKEAIKNEQGVIRSGDPYEFCAWLRHQPQADFEHPIAALDQLWRVSEDLRSWCAPYVYEIGNRRSVNGLWVVNDWDALWRFLVVCEPE